MKNYKISNILLWAATLVSFVLTILTAIFGFTSDSAFSKVVLIVVSVLILLLTVMLAYLAYLCTFDADFSLKSLGFGKMFKNQPADKPNYFLNPNGKRTGMQPEALTFEYVNERILAFVVENFETPVAMWKNEIFAEDDCFGKDGVFKTLVAYKMIYDLQSRHSKKLWTMFFELPQSEFEDICSCLARNGDEEFAEQLKDLKANEGARLRDGVAFLDQNAEYIKRRMVN